MWRPAGSKNKKTLRKEAMERKKQRQAEREMELLKAWIKGRTAWWYVPKDGSEVEGNNWGGRKAMFNDPKELQERIDEYFETTQPKMWTLTWLALACGFKTLKSLRSYGEKEEFADLVSWAMMKIEHAYEIDLKHFGRSGTIFALKNMDWSDKTQVESVALNLSLGGGITDGQMLKLAERYVKMYDLLKTPDGYVSKEEAEEEKEPSEISGISGIS